MYYVYILKSKKDNNLFEGKSQATKWRLPIELIYYEAYKDEKNARKREIFLKSGRGREIIQKQLENSLK